MNSPASPLAGAEEVLRAMAARRELYPNDRLMVAVRRDGFTHCAVKFVFSLREFDFWDEPDEPPEANSEGVPTSPRHRAILVMLAERGPLFVDAIAEKLGVDRPKLYRGVHSIKGLAAMGHIEHRAGEGYALTAKGRRAAAAIEEEGDGEHS